MPIYIQYLYIHCIYTVHIFKYIYKTTKVRLFQIHRPLSIISYTICILYIYILSTVHIWIPIQWSADSFSLCVFVFYCIEKGTALRSVKNTAFLEEISLNRGQSFSAIQAAARSDSAKTDSVRTLITKVSGAWMLFILCTLLLALKRLWQALESWHLKVGHVFLSIAAWTVRLQLENDEQKKVQKM